MTPASRRHSNSADLTTLLLRNMAEQPPQRNEFSATFALAREHPTVLAAMLTSFGTLEQSLVDIVAARTGERPEDEAPRLFAALAVTALQDRYRKLGGRQPQGRG
ncbi:hypothetical protein [Streptomyces pseudovenezuelae]|uniref:MftR C-terminal domain-containing protein n=1 Tax=Streptomyces pseudovenezuelae TaxID=67350 RepID=A0ABZ1XAW8_9ACTN|nr:hypothetical protein [Streptomyces pseudovenezuelae]